MIDKEAILNERGWLCEICENPTSQPELHHCLFHRMKGIKELDEKFNLQVVCPACHSLHANDYENRRAFWDAQVRRYGGEMQEWFDRLPLKVKKY